MTDQQTPAPNAATRPARARELIVATFAVAIGIAIAWVDTRPNWDDTGVTAGALVLTAGFAGVAGLRWWGAALLVAAPILVLETPSAGVGVLAFLAFTALGSLIGVGIRRMLGDGVFG